jgi:hypothetical protein
MFSTGINIFTLIFYVHGLLGVFIKGFGSKNNNFSRKCNLIKKSKNCAKVLKIYIYI